MKKLDWWTSQHPDSFHYRCDVYEIPKIGIIAHVKDENGTKSVTNMIEAVIMDILEQLHTSLYDEGYETFGDIVEDLIIIHTDSQGDRAIIKYSWNMVEHYGNDSKDYISKVRWEPIGKGLEILYDLK
jgi:hypothetical protein